MPNERGVCNNMQDTKALQEKYRKEILEFYNKTKQSQSIIEENSITQSTQYPKINEPSIIPVPKLPRNPVEIADTTQSEFSPAVDVQDEFNKIDGIGRGNDRPAARDNDSYVQVPSVFPSNPELYGGMGQLTVNVTTAQGAIPVPNATVVVEKQILTENGLQKILVDVALTDESGRTIGVIELPTKPKELSLSPDFPDPFSRYQVYVIAKGFKPVTLDDVYMFDGIESIQNVDLIPN